MKAPIKLHVATKANATCPIKNPMIAAAIAIVHVQKTIHRLRMLLRNSNDAEMY